MGLDAARGLLACPVCAGPLEADGSDPVRSWACGEGHRFDVARQGHLNLLRAAQPAHADTPAMVEARGRVLASGAFDAVDAALARRASGMRTVLDVGGGTGHHLARLLDALPDARGISLDVSAPAARRAAKAHPRAASVVADAWGTLPVRTKRIGLAMCVFAPRNMAEFARVLADGGLLLVVAPDPAHLLSLRERYGLLGIEPDKDERLARTASAHFESIGRHRLRSPLTAGADLVRDLIAMGPNAFHGVPEEVEAIDTEVAVSVWLFRPRR
ncbi:MAG TPA: methyltransferase domain-containing protein [Propionibacterium sp.]|nr:methyltransferase domain-containing protein [Propionibacterium sp.]